MPPRRNPRRNPNNETPPPQPPTPQFDTTALNAVVVAAVATAMAQYHASGSTGGGGTPVNSIQVEAPVRSRGAPTRNSPTASIYPSKGWAESLPSRNGSRKPNRFSKSALVRRRARSSLLLAPLKQKP